MLYDAFLTTAESYIFKARLYSTKRRNVIPLQALIQQRTNVTVAKQPSLDESAA